jgi:putative FmdB family regulatory protein
MVRYDFKCQQCGAIEEHVFSMAQKPDHLTCECGGRAESLISLTAEQVLIKDGERPFKLSALDMPVGWQHGNTDCEKQEARYRKIVARDRKLAADNKKKAIKGGIQKIATVPRELDRLRKKQYGKDYWSEDTERKLKQDGLFYG